MAGTEFALPTVFQQNHQLTTIDPLTGTIQGLTAAAAYPNTLQLAHHPGALTAFSRPAAAQQYAQFIPTANFNMTQHANLSAISQYASLSHQATVGTASALPAIAAASSNTQAVGQSSAGSIVQANGTVDQLTTSIASTTTPQNTWLVYAPMSRYASTSADTTAGVYPQFHMSSHNH